MSNGQNINQQKRISDARSRVFWILLLVLFMSVGTILRFTGLNWDENQHLHPDERFLTMVESAIRPVNSFAEYFDTGNSTLNPNNVGHGFYVYGTFPIFVVRYLAEWLDKTGYDQVYLVGRAVSAIADIFTCLLVFLIGLKLYKRWSIAVLAAGFSSFAVLQIQLSHFFTVDVFANFFLVLSLNFIVLIQQGFRTNLTTQNSLDQSTRDYGLVALVRENWSGIWLYIFFGLSLGMAAASKISSAPIAVLLPIILGVELIHSPKEMQKARALIFIRNTVIAAVVSMLTFRILQPYAFTGPGFFGLLLNPKWLSNMRELSQMSAGNVDFPPALQWARRPITFALNNMVFWGMGVVWGAAAWLSFLFMAWKMIKGHWRNYFILWGWTAIYFSLQSVNFTRSMRYQLPVYPSLAIIAAWGLITLWDSSSGLRKDENKIMWGRITRIATGLLIAVILLSTSAYGFAFTRIYTKPVTRVAASEWIYQNVPAAINLQINDNGEIINHPISFKSGREISSGHRLTMAFTPKQQVYLLEASFTYVIDPLLASQPKTLITQVSTDSDGYNVISTGMLADTFQAQPDPRGKAYDVTFAPNILLEDNVTYYLQAYTYDEADSLRISGPINLKLLNGSTESSLAMPDPVEALGAGMIYETVFSPVESGMLESIYFPHIVDLLGEASSKNLKITVAEYTPAQEEYVARLVGNFAAIDDVRGMSYSAKASDPLVLDKDRQYRLIIENTSDFGQIAIYGSKQANETSWDDPLPVSLHGFSPFDYSSGIYRTELNFEMYWDEDETKRERFISILDQADYLFISSSRQWGSVVQIPERYPLANTYYRQLIGCPENQDIYRCYSDAVPGLYTGNLGYELIKTFQSEPTLGGVQFNSQYAEEAFTVYDHPKVLIFKKSDNYSGEKVRDIFNAVDLSQVIHLTPKEASGKSINPMLTDELENTQTSGGTWSMLFNRLAIYNQVPILGAVLWYLTLVLLGVVFFPLTNLIFKGLPDRGYAVSKIIGLLTLTWCVWILGSAGVKVSRTVITLVFISLLVFNGVIAFKQKAFLVRYIANNKKYILYIELISLALFLIFLAIRLGNPDLWHPYKGGEKPMDFSYLNAIIKSDVYPPYDPWFAGGYINYYYYGFVIYGVLIKWLGIMPSIGYNLLLITVFCFTGLGVFTIGWNFFDVLTKHYKQFSLSDLEPEHRNNNLYGYMAGIGAVILYQFVGNLGTVRMIWQGFQRLAYGYLENAGIITKLIWTFEGFAKTLSGQKLPYAPGDWYWIPSRAIPGDVITEFPAFTFLYGDPHAHMMALPITLLALIWALSFIRHRWKWHAGNRIRTIVSTIISLAGGAWIVGMLKPTNTWDYYTYLVICSLAILFTSINQLPEFRRNAIGSYKKWIIPVVAIVFFTLLSALLFKPFSDWYGQAYTKINLWQGEKSPLGSYLIHWGYLLFIISTWYTWETRNWMAATPLSSLKKLYPFRSMVYLGLILLVVMMVVLLFMEVSIALIVIPLGVWTIMLMLRNGQDEVKRFVLFLIGTGLMLTLVVELVVIEGDVGRMNTLFKFYLQAWTLLSIGSAAGLIWTFRSIQEEWLSRWRTAWLIPMTVLTASVLLFPVLATTDKINDRISDDAPHTLNGMAFMPYSTYFENGSDMDLSQDYDAIQWMQDNISGSPVIVEANIPEYRWGSRYSIYTGLPGVVGWNWHQRQQRAISNSNQVFDRVAAIGEFYQTQDIKIVESFLRKFDVSFIVVGQLERVTYPAEGLQKFSEWDKVLWEQVYQSKQTTIYRVIKER